jgi:hypothetical protein
VAGAREPRPRTEDDVTRNKGAGHVAVVEPRTAHSRSVLPKHGTLQRPDHKRRRLGRAMVVASTKVALEGVYLVCDRLPRVFDRRWGPGAASALADEADRLNLERRRLLCVDGFSVLPASLTK